MNSVPDEDIARWRRWRGRRFGAWIYYLRHDLAMLPEVEPTWCQDLLDLCRAGGWVQPFYGDMPPDDSEDSYNCFVRRNKITILSYSELTARGMGTPTATERRAAQQQLAYEAEQRAKQQAKEAEADAQWAAEEARRQQAEKAALAAADAQWQGELRKNGWVWVPGKGWIWPGT